MNAKQDRIHSIDILRGIAVLGILLMNIQSFSMISAAYGNPTSFGDLSGLNRVAYIFSHIIADQKFISIFSILFGASIIIMSEQIEFQGKNSFVFHYSRTFWLIVIGIIHAYCIWHGDILTIYAVLSFFLFWFRKFKPSFLFGLGVLFFSIGSILYFFIGLYLTNLSPVYTNDIILYWQPPPEFVQSEVHAFRGRWTQQLQLRYENAISLQTTYFLMQLGWKVFGLMLMGMAFYKWEFLNANKSKSFYTKFFIFTIIFGLGITIIGLYYNFYHKWSWEFSMFQGSLFNYWGSLFLSFGYISLVMLFSQTENFHRTKKCFSSVGKLALTNYILQSLISTYIFYGHGLGYFGKLERSEQLYVVVLIWSFQIIFSLFWLKYFSKGPLEYIWRKLTNTLYDIIHNEKIFKIVQKK